MNDNRNLVIIDTDIWVYMFDENDEVKRNISKRLINKNKILLTTQILNEISINLIRKYSYTEMMIKDFINKLYSNYTIVDFNQNVFLKASEFREKYYLNYWDSLIVAVAYEYGASMIYSDKIKDGIVIEGKVGVINPYKF